MYYSTTGTTSGPYYTSYSKYESPTQICGCGCGILSYKRFCQGHSVQNRRKALKRMHLPLGGKAGKKLRKRKKEAVVKKTKWGY